MRAIGYLWAGDVCARRRGSGAVGGDGLKLLLHWRRNDLFLVLLGLVTRESVQAGRTTGCSGRSGAARR
jgi:hypothetical protein